MPVYEYGCSGCSLKFESLRPMAEADGVECPRCHRRAKRLLSRFASFSRSAEGVSAPISGTAPSCGSCSSSSCGTCGH
ncbi:MAG: zinc ribbon domain-containing protein [Chloroflexi bacterium]|nr:zinc ribbon domain-containing protein [Chloroflexota bacterium]